jgi:hypothetical protein
VTNPTEITTIANQNTRRQRGERSRPCGNNSKINGPQENSKDQVKTQATQSPTGSERRAYCCSRMDADVRRPKALRSHPIGFRDKREATRTPTVENAATMGTKAYVSGTFAPFHRSRRSAKAVIATVISHSDRAIGAALRLVIFLCLRPRSLEAYVTDLLYSTIVSRALR